MTQDTGARQTFSNSQSTGILALARERIRSRIFGLFPACGEQGCDRSVSHCGCSEVAAIAISEFLSVLQEIKLTGEMQMAGMNAEIAWIQSAQPKLPDETDYQRGLRTGVMMLNGYRTELSFIGIISELSRLHKEGKNV